MKKIIIVASVVLLMVLGGILYFVISSKEENVMDTYGQNIDIIMNQYPTKVMVLGDKIEFRSQLKYEMVSKITESWYAFEPGKYNGTVLIVNNLCGDVSLTDRDYELIKKGIQNQGVQFIYLGGNLQSFIDHEVWGGMIFLVMNWVWLSDGTIIRSAIFPEFIRKRIKMFSLEIRKTCH